MRDDFESFRMAEVDRQPNMAYLLTPEEREAVIRLNVANGKAHLCAERNTGPEGMRTAKLEASAARKLQRQRERNQVRNARLRGLTLAKAAVVCAAFLLGLWGGA